MRDIFWGNFIFVAFVQKYIAHDLYAARTSPSPVLEDANQELDAHQQSHVVVKTIYSIVVLTVLLSALV